jgi:hypothetical protein
MNSHGNRARLGGVLVAVAAVLALIALPGLASGHRGHDDPAPAGTVQSFDSETHVLTIALTEGGSVSGLVTRRTQIRCDNGRHRGRHGLRHHKRGRGQKAAASRRGGDDESGDRSGRGAGESGDDNHRSGELEPGDDRGNDAEPGDDRGDRGHHGSRRCRAGLTEGATVKLAELVLIDGKAIYKAVVLPKPAKEDDGEEGEGESEAPSAE